MQPYTFQPWAWREPIATTGYAPPTDAEADEVASEGVGGYHVEATDGQIGTVDEATYDVDGSYLVVDTGPWIFGRKVLLPAGTVQRVDREDRRVYVDRTKDQIKNSPEYDKDTFETPEYREQVGTYYSDNYRDYPG